MPPSKGVLRVIHEQVILPLYFRKEKLEVIHFTGNVISFVLFKRSVFTVQWIDSFAVTSLRSTRNIMRRFWNRRLESGGFEGRATFPSLDGHRR
jgi:hypothetical protein